MFKLNSTILLACTLANEYPSSDEWSGARGLYILFAMHCVYRFYRSCCKYHANSVNPDVRCLIYALVDLLQKLVFSGTFFY